MNYDNFTKEQIVSILKDTLEYLSKLREEIEELNEFLKYANDEVVSYANECIRLDNIINEIKSQLDYLETYSSKEDVFEDMKRRLDRIESIVNRK